MNTAPPVTPVPLRRNRDFQLYWTGQFLSELGSRVSGIAFPLLVLALTASPAKAGIAGFVAGAPLLLLLLHAGALLDRSNRKRVMIACEAVRAVALASVAIAYVLDELTFAHILVVAFVEGVGWVFFDTASRSAVRHLVPAEQLPTAIAQNQARDYGAHLLGPALGGFLFGLSRALPFLLDAITYLISLITLLFVRPDFQEERARERRHFRREISEGVSFLWRQPLLRTTSLLGAGSDLVLNTLFLVVIVLAQEQGASPALVGAMFIFVGVGGVLGAMIAPLLTRRVHVRVIVVGTEWAVLLLMPLLLVVEQPIAIGIVLGAMFIGFPAWNAVIGAYRLALVPDRLQARVQSVSTLLHVASVPVALLAVGFTLERFGTTETILGLLAIMVVVAVCAAASRSVREAPALDELELVSESPA